VECPTGSGKYLTIAEWHRVVASAVAVFLKDASAPAGAAADPQLQSDPNYQDCIPFMSTSMVIMDVVLGVASDGVDGLIAKLLMPRVGE